MSVLKAGFIIVCLAVAGLVYWQTASLRGGFYEPLGPGALPRALAIMLFILALIMTAAIVRNRSSAPAEGLAVAGAELRGAVGLLLTVSYVFTLSAEILRFLPASISFLLVFGMAIAPDRTRSLPKIAIASVLIPLLTWYVFTVHLRIELF